MINVAYARSEHALVAYGRRLPRACHPSRSGRGASEKNYGRLGDIAQSEQEREIRIGRNDDSVLARSARKYLLVTCCLHSPVAQVHTVVTVPAQISGEQRRQRIVDQESHRSTSGISLSRTASAA